MSSSISVHQDLPLEYPPYFPAAEALLVLELQRSAAFALELVQASAVDTESSVELVERMTVCCTGLVGFVSAADRSVCFRS